MMSLGNQLKPFMDAKLLLSKYLTFTFCAVTGFCETYISSKFWVTLRFLGASLRISISAIKYFRFFSRDFQFKIKIVENPFLPTHWMSRSKIGANATEDLLLSELAFMPNNIPVYIIWTSSVIATIALEKKVIKSLIQYIILFPVDLRRIEVQIIHYTRMHMLQSCTILVGLTGRHSEPCILFHGSVRFNKLGAVTVH